MLLLDKKLLEQFLCLPRLSSMAEPCGGTLRFLGYWILTIVCVTEANILASTSSAAARTGAFLFGTNQRDSSHYDVTKWILEFINILQKGYY